MDLFIEIQARTEKFQELLQALPTLMPALQFTEGCRGSRIYKDAQDGELLLLFIQWNDLADLHNYMLSDHGGAILGAINLLGQKVRVRIDTENDWKGIETLKQLRSSSFFAL
jgi:quinol monooxygenase YgiN